LVATSFVVSVPGCPPEAEPDASRYRTLAAERPPTAVRSADAVGAQWPNVTARRATGSMRPPRTESGILGMPVDKRW
jgi:hypothetical protein